MSVYLIARLLFVLIKSLKGSTKTCPNFKDHHSPFDGSDASTSNLINSVGKYSQESQSRLNPVRLAQLTELRADRIVGRRKSQNLGH